VTDNELAFLRDDPEMADLFLAEALDHLGTIEAALLALDERPGDVALLNDIFRPFHTIKGNAGALGVTSVQEVAHSVENLLDLARSGQLAEPWQIAKHRQILDVRFASTVIGDANETQVRKIQRLQ